MSYLLTNGEDLLTGIDNKILVSQSKQPYALGLSTNNRLVAPYAGSKFSSTDSVSLAFWCKVNTGYTGYSGLYACRGGGLGENIYANSANGGRWEYWSLGHPTAANGMTSTVAASVKAGQYQLVVLTKNRELDQSILYVDGVKGNIGVVAAKQTSATYPDTIGAIENNQFYFNGEIHSATVYLGVLTDQQVLDLGRGIEPSNTKIVDGKVTYNGLLKDNISGSSFTAYNNPVLKTSTAPVGQRSELSFDGVDDVLQVDSVPIISNQNFTMYGWIIPMALTSSLYPRVFGLTNAANNQYLSFMYTGSEILIVSKTSSEQYLSLGTYPTNKNKWIFLALTYTASTKTIKGYIGDSYIGEMVLSTALLENLNRLIVGKNAFTSLVDRAKCKVSNITLIQEVLNITQIKANMYSYLPANYPNLIEQWKLNEGIGSVAYGTKGNNGTITGATWTTPSLMNYVGKQLNLNGTSSHVTSKNVVGINQFTIECIFKARQVPVAGQQLVVKSTDGKGFGMYLSGTSGQPKLYGYIRHGAGATIATSTTNIVSNTHYHGAFSYDGSNLRLYINGLLEQTIPTPTPMTPDDVTPVNLGALFWAGNWQYFLDGFLDEVRIWNIARTATEILENKDRTMDRHPNLVLNMGFESGYWDASGYGNHGTAVGSPVIEVTDNDKLLLNAPIN